MARFIGPVFDFASAILAGVGSWIANLLSSFLTAPLAEQHVAQNFPALAPSEVYALVDYASQSMGAALAAGSSAAYNRVTLSEIPVCTGCPANTIETRLLVTLLDEDGNRLVDADVACTSNRIPTFADIEDCVRPFVRNLRQVAPQYAVGGVGMTSQTVEGVPPAYKWEVKTMQRGAFFGK